MGNFNRDRNSRDGGRRSYGGDFRGRDRYPQGGRNDKQMFKTVCSNCGRDCEVPFRPTGDKPVYCSDCFEKMGGRGERKSFDRPRFSDRRVTDDQHKAQFEAVNNKLDQILSLLQPKPIVEPEVKIEAVVETPTEELEVKPSKSKKVSKAKSPEKSK